MLQEPITLGHPEWPKQYQPVGRTSVGLSVGNSAIRSGEFQQALSAYALACVQSPDLAAFIAPNIASAKAGYLRQKDSSIPVRVGVCGWELGRNAAGRAHTLAQLYQRFANTELIGPLWGGEGSQLWEPIRETTVPLRPFMVEQSDQFMPAALTFVAQNPYDIVHLSKPRAPNIILGLLYQRLWGSKVFVDVDDEELAFVGSSESIDPIAHALDGRRLPPLSALSSREWTQLAVGALHLFDSVTVSNPALQARYGGIVVGHARNEDNFKSSRERTLRNRNQFGVPHDAKVILFFGTPRAHKGLLETAQAIAQLLNPKVLFLIVGDFPDPALKQQLLRIDGVRYQFIGNQPFHHAADIVSMADLTVLMQNATSLVGEYQTPAKLVDALAMQVPAVVQPTPALQHLVDTGAVAACMPSELARNLQRLLMSPNSLQELAQRGHQYYLSHWSFSKLQPLLQQLVSTRVAGAQNVSNTLLNHWLHPYSQAFASPGRNT